ncbi:MAG: hypothetical protein RL660_2177 [Bacteroidota bacterium]|jgi:hypothetical protein
MKKVLGLALALFGSPLLFAQTHGSSNLTEALNQYTACNLSSDVPCILDYMWPEIFEIQDRESIAKELENSFTDGLVHFDTVWCGKTVLLKKIETVQYGLVPFGMKISMAVEMLEAQAGSPDDVVKALAMQHGKENVKLSADKKTISVTPQGQYIVARQMAPNEHWFLLDYNQARMMLAGSLPSEFTDEADPIVDPTGEMFRVDTEVYESSEYAMPDTFVVESPAVEAPAPEPVKNAPTEKPTTKKAAAPKAAATKRKK